MISTSAQKLVSFLLGCGWSGRKWIEVPPMYLGKMAKKMTIVYPCWEKSFYILLLVLKEQFHVREEVLIQIFGQF